MIERVMGGSIDSNVEFSSPVQSQEGKESFSRNSVVAVTRQLLGEKAGLKTDMALDLGKETVHVSPFIASSSKLTPETFSSSLSNIVGAVNENSSFYPKLIERGTTGFFEVGIGINSANVDIAFPKEFVKEGGEKIELGPEQQKAFRKTVTEYTSLIKRGIYLEGLKETLEKTGGEVKDLQGTQANLDVGTVEVLFESANRASEIKAQRAYEIANGLPPRTSEVAQSMPITARREFATPTVNQQEIKAREPEFRLSARKKILVGGSIVTLVTTAACALVPSFQPTATVTEIPTETKTASPTVSPTPEKTNTPTVTPTQTETLTPTEKPIETIDLPLTDGGTFTVDKFDTTQEALDYIAKNSLWKNIDRNNLGAMDKWLQKGNDVKNGDVFFNNIKKIIGWNPSTEVDPPSSDKEFFSVAVNRVGDGTLLIFETTTKEYSAVYININADTFVSESKNYTTPTPTPNP